MRLKEDWRRLDEDAFMLKYGPYAAFAVVLLILSIGLFVPSIDVTWPLVALALVLVFVPYLPLLRRAVSVRTEGDNGLTSLLYEAEETVDQSPEDVHSDVESRVSNLESDLLSRMKEDPTNTVVRLRVEIEEALTEYARERGMRTGDEFVQFHDVLRYLKDNEEAMEQPLYEDVMEVQSVTSRAVRGASLDQASATRIVRLGLRVLERLYAESDMPVNPDVSEPAFAGTDSRSTLT